MSEHGHVISMAGITPIGRGAGVRSIPLVGNWIGAVSLTIGLTLFEPGTGIRLHHHNCDESVVILEGEATCEFGGEVHKMKPFDTTFVPAGIPHRFWNQGAAKMTILWIYASANVTRTFSDTGETVEHLSPADRATE